MRVKTMQFQNALSSITKSFSVLITTSCKDLQPMNCSFRIIEHGSSTLMAQIQSTFAYSPGGAPSSGSHSLNSSCALGWSISGRYSLSSVCARLIKSGSLLASIIMSFSTTSSSRWCTSWRRLSTMRRPSCLCHFANVSSGWDTYPIAEWMGCLSDRDRIICTRQFQRPYQFVHAAIHTHTPCTGARRAQHARTDDAPGGEKRRRRRRGFIARSRTSLLALKRAVPLLL